MKKAGIELLLIVYFESAPRYAFVFSFAGIFAGEYFFFIPVASFIKIYSVLSS